MSMPVLTLHQPWASLIATGVKTIETRGHRTNVRGRIAIHAAARPVDRGWVGGWLVDRTRSDGGWMRRSTLDPSFRLPLGAIVATAELTDCVPMVDEHPQWDGQAYLHVGVDLTLVVPWCGKARRGDIVSSQRPYGDFRPGRWAWLLADVEPLAEPVPFKGGQGWSRTWDGS
jgi:hypothetical protein